MKENDRWYMCMFVCLNIRYWLCIRSRISRVQYWDCMHVFSIEHFLHQNGHGFSCSSFIVGRTIDTMSTQNIPACNFLHISPFSQCDNFRVRGEVRRARKKGKRAERARWMYPCVRRPSPFPCLKKKIFCVSLSSTPFLSRFPPDARVNTILASRAKLF